MLDECDELMYRIFEIQIVVVGWDKGRQRIKVKVEEPLIVSRMLFGSYTFDRFPAD